jgi:hypothetical protein
MVKVYWPSFVSTQVGDCFNAWYMDMHKREYNNQSLKGAAYNKAIAKGLAKYKATAINREITFEITFKNKADYTFFLLKWS